MSVARHYKFKRRNSRYTFVVSALARISHVGRIEVAKTPAGTAQLDKRVPTPCRQENQKLATEAPAATPVARSGLQVGEKSGLVKIVVPIFPFTLKLVNIEEISIWLHGYPGP